MLRSVICIVPVFVFAGCASSPPKQFYALEPVAARPVAANGSGAPVQIAAVNIPPILDRQEMVHESGSNTLELSYRHRWGAPLADMIRDVMTEDLLRRLPARRVVLPRSHAPAGAYEITLDILKFAATDTGEVVFEGGWSLYELGSDTPLLSRKDSLSERADVADYAAQVNAMSRILGRVADEITETLITRAIDAGNVP